MASRSQQFIVAPGPRQRLWGALLLGAGLVLTTALLREPGTVAPGAFHARKLTWDGEADLVLGGCSRVNLSVSPAILREHMPDRRILNFAFDNNAYSQAYLRRLARVLDPDSPQPTIVLGIQPGNFTTRSEQRNAFVAETRRQATGRHANRTIPAFRPIELAGLRRLRLGGKPLLCNKRQYRDGWSPMTVRPRQTPATVARNRAFWRASAIEERLVRQLLAHVRRWTDAGIRVYAFRPPSSPEIVAIERDASGFDEATFRRRFAAAGGHWLHVAQFAYRTFDGVHLDAAAAERFSTDLGQALARQLPPGEADDRWVRQSKDGR